MDTMCSVSKALDVIGGKWKSVALYYLLKGPLRFNQLRRLMPSVTQRMLTLQLRELERDGLLRRTVYPVVPPHVEYALTDKGRTLEPLLIMLRDWGWRHAGPIIRQRDNAASALVDAAPHMSHA
jgi:DNA-binding HxlR family transcriptional regulator